MLAYFSLSLSVITQISRMTSYSAATVAPIIHCLSYVDMLQCRAVKVIVPIGLLVLLAAVSLGCGGAGMPSLTVQPATASGYTDYETGLYQAVVLTAKLSNGQMPSGLTWSTDHPCVAVGNPVQNTETVVCNFTCGTGTQTATITASSEGMTAHSTVTCTWR